MRLPQDGVGFGLWDLCSSTKRELVTDSVRGKPLRSSVSVGYSLFRDSNMEDRTNKEFGIVKEVFWGDCT